MASSAVSSATQQLGMLLVNEAKSLYNVRDKIETLQKELTWMECFLKDADAQQYQEKVVQMWVFDIQDLAYDAEDIIVRYLNEVHHHRRDGVRNTIKWFSSIVCLCDARKLHNLSSDIDGLTGKISELTSRLQTYGIKVIRPTANSEYNVKIMEERRTYSHTHEDVVGIDKDIEEVADQLVKSDVVKVVVLSGIGGLGKTTLARKVFKHKDVKDHFNDNCAWVYISKEFEKEIIFKLVLLELEKSEEERKKIKELQPQQLCGELHKMLQVKRCLVVIDDIWTEEAWKSIKSGFESVCATTSASKILITTRNQGLFQHVDPFRYDRPLKHLSDDESWKLLQRNAYIGQRSTTCTDVDGVTREDEMEKLGKKMLKHCDGIPIAIVALGGILSHKRTISEWEEVSNNISSYLMGNMSQLDRNAGGILKVIELSFHDLPLSLKPCFLYLGNFPEDYKISAMRLYNLWEAEGFLVIEDEVTKRRGSSYEIGERYLNELIQRCMVQVGKCDSNGRVKECQLHDVMRDMCLRKCEEARFLNYIKGEQDNTALIEMKKWRRCVVNDGKEDTIDKQFEHGERAIGVRSLLVFQRKVMLSKVWKCFPLLRVLDLEGVTLTDGMDMDGVGLLIHLRYLSIRKTEVRILPSCLYDLRCLETLDLRGSRTIKLLNKFDRMKRLIHLYLPKWFEVEGDKKLKFPCSLMETLKNFDTSKCDTAEVMQMTKLRAFSIRKYNIIEKREDVKLLLEAPVIKNEGQLLNSFGLEIRGNIVNEDPEILSSASRNPCFNKLKIENRMGAEGELLGGGKSIVFWESLTRVEILFYDIMEEDMLALMKLPRLNYLYLIGFVGNKLSLPPGSFPNLTTLLLNCSDKLEELNVGDGALPILQTLYLSKWKTGFTLSALEKLCNLKSLHLSFNNGVGKLNFCGGIFPQLTELDINNAKELEELSFGDGALPNLQSFKLGWCEKLKKLTNIPNTITSVELRDGDLFLSDFEKLPRLQRLYIGVSKVKKLMFSAGSFPNLTKLEIYNLELEELEVGIGSLPNLQHLDLYSCPKLKKLPEGLPPSLKITLRRPDVAATRFKWLPRRLRLPSTTN